jgi:hypothetical protein
MMATGLPAGPVKGTLTHLGHLLILTGAGHLVSS